MVAPVAIGIGLLSMAGSMADQAEENDMMRQKASDHGLRSGGILYARDRNSTMIERNNTILRENSEADRRYIEMKQSEAEADARVISAAAGVAGDSIDDVVGETERNAAEASAQISKQEDQRKAQQTIDFVDNQVNADIQKGVFHSATDTKKGAIKAGLGFIQGFQLGL